MDIVRCGATGQVLVHHAEKKLLVYYCIGDPQFDSARPAKLDMLTDEDRKIANKLGARCGKECWKKLVGEDGRDISAIKGELNLGSMSDDDWDAEKQQIRKCLETLLRESIHCARLTKALHKKRPELIPVCDSDVVDYLLPGADKESAATIIGVMDEFRKDLRYACNMTTLRDMRGYLDKRSKTFNWLPEGFYLTDLRMLEKLYWMEKKYDRLWPEMKTWWEVNGG
jgi:hypothetical protein